MLVTNGLMHFFLWPFESDCWDHFVNNYSLREMSQLSSSFCIPVALLLLALVAVVRLEHSQYANFAVPVAT